jgi:hypothetical protein
MRTALRYCFAIIGAHAGVQLLLILCSQISNTPGRILSGSVKGFVRVDVSHIGNDIPVRQ